MSSFSLINYRGNFECQINVPKMFVDFDLLQTKIHAVI